MNKIQNFNQIVIKRKPWTLVQGASFTNRLFGLKID